jgi:hypothetical protein
MPRNGLVDDRPQSGGKVVRIATIAAPEVLECGLVFVALLIRGDEQVGVLRLVEAGHIRSKLSHRHFLSRFSRSDLKCALCIFLYATAKRPRHARPRTSLTSANKPSHPEKTPKRVRKFNFGSSKDDRDNADFNVIAQNQVEGRSDIDRSFKKSGGDENAKGNLFEKNTSVKSRVQRTPGCAVFQGTKNDFIANGASVGGQTCTGSTIRL